MGGPAGTEPETGPGKSWVEDRREHLRGRLLDQPIQASGHPQQTLSAPGFGDHHPADRQRPVGARVQGLPYTRPVLAKPRPKFGRGHAVHTRSAPVGLHTPQRPGQVLRGEHPLPQRDFQPRKNSPFGVRRLAATLHRGTQRDSPFPPTMGPHPRDGCDHRDRYEHHRFGCLLDVRSFPADVRSPAGTTTSADFCPVSSHLAVTAVGAAMWSAQPTPEQTSPDKSDHFPPTPAAFTHQPSWR
jgi:hypothetical protein